MESAEILYVYGVPEELVALIEDLYPVYSKSKSAARIEGELTEWFKIRVGVGQGCGMSPDLFNLILEIVMRLARKEGSDTVNLNGRPLDNIHFANNIDLLADTMQGDLGEPVGSDEQSGRQQQENETQDKSGKTKTMAIGNSTSETRWWDAGSTRFVYRGGLITENGRCEEDVKRRIRPGMCSIPGT